jgi:hypothetical protein
LLKLAEHLVALPYRLVDTLNAPVLQLTIGDLGKYGLRQ